MAVAQLSPMHSSAARTRSSEQVATANPELDSLAEPAASYQQRWYEAQPKNSEAKDSPLAVEAADYPAQAQDFVASLQTPLSLPDMVNSSMVNSSIANSATVNPAIVNPAAMALTEQTSGVGTMPTTVSAAASAQNAAQLLDGMPVMTVASDSALSTSDLHSAVLHSQGLSGPVFANEDLSSAALTATVPSNSTTSTMAALALTSAGATDGINQSTLLTQQLSADALTAAATAQSSLTTASQPTAASGAAPLLFGAHFGSQAGAQAGALAGTQALASFGGAASNQLSNQAWQQSGHGQSAALMLTGGSDATSSLLPVGHTSTAGNLPVWQSAPLNPQSSQFAKQLWQLLGDKAELQLGLQVKKALVRLDPPSLGSLELSVSLDGDRLNVQVHSNNAMLRDAMAQGLEQLRASLAQRLGSELQVDVQLTGQASQLGQQQAGQQHAEQQSSAAANWQPGADEALTEQAATGRTGSLSRHLVNQLV